MNSKYEQDSGDAAFARTDYTRRDVRRRDIVNHAISVQESGNTVSALEYLKAHDIEAAVIERVLLEPLKRRGPIHH
jgi:hypothetical protein